MTKEEAIQKLIALSGSDDPETAHSDADEILLNLINDLEIANAYNNIHKWYA